MILIGLGGNLASRFGTPRQTLEAALAALPGQGARVLRVSPFYRTRPVPVSDQPWFVNAVAEVETSHGPSELLAALHRIEDEFGRVREIRNEPRIIDLDLLDYDGRIMLGQPMLPHPRLQKRAFVLLPLADLVPDWTHPVSRRPIAELLAELPFDQTAERMEGAAPERARAERRYLRPLGVLSGGAASAALENGTAMPLAGGPLAFSAVEQAIRSRGKIVRSILPLAAVREDKAQAEQLDRICRRRPLSIAGVMGIINVTPDSFSDGAVFADSAAAIAHGAALLEAGATILDIGGDSTRPGADPTRPAEEMRRVLPVIEGLAPLAKEKGALVSVDTMNAVTMRAAVAAGAGMLNDITALAEPANLTVAAETGVPVVLMHMQGTPKTMQADPRYDDAALDIYDFLAGRIAACEAAGIPRERLIVDPGIGFGKTIEHNLQLLARIALFHGLGVPLLIGASRKGFIGRLSRREPPGDRLGGSLAAALAAVAQGVQIVRVHDVAATTQALRIAQAIGGAG